MKARELLSIAVASATLAMSTASFADDDRRGGRRHHDGPVVERQVERHVYRHDHRRDFDRRDFERRDFDRRDFDRRGHHHYHGPRVVYRDVHVVHQGPRWHRGQYLPREYRGPRYVVVNHHPQLYAPPRGHQWMQVNGEFLLVAVATGLIAHAILNH